MPPWLSVCLCFFWFEWNGMDSPALIRELERFRGQLYYTLVVNLTIAAATVVIVVMCLLGIRLCSFEKKNPIV